MSQQEAIHQVISALKTLTESLSALNEEPTPKPQAENQTTIYTLEDVRAVLAEISRSGKREAVQQLLREFGVQKLSELDSARYPALLHAAEAIR
jgi:hypothetical protein